MLDARIYRTAFIAVALAVIVFAFSLRNEPGALRTSLAPQAFSGSAASTLAKSLVKNTNLSPGSAQDGNVAAGVQRDLQQVGAVGGKSTMTTSSETSEISTIDGTRSVQTVTAVNPGLSSGTIAIVAPRDSARGPAAASMSATAVLVELANVIHQQSLRHSVMFISTSGSVGGDGMAQIARQLAGQPIDAVIVLGDLAARQPSQPVVIPWSNGDTVAPAVLRRTLSAALGSQAATRSRSSSFPAQVARLAFPVTPGAQAPFIGAGIPTVLLSLSGERGPTPGELLALDPHRMGQIGQAVLQTIDAIDAGPTIAPPVPYLVLSSKIVPFWAIRLLVLALLLPVLAVTVDGVARARRRGHTITRWAGWVLAGAVPFVLGVLVIKAAKLASVISVAPPNPVPAGVIPLGGGGLTTLILVVLVVAASFALIRPVLIQISARLSGEEIPRGQEHAAGECAGPALLLVASLVAIVLWASNPFAAALLVPALHVWVWVVDAEVRIRRPLKLLLMLIGLIPPALVIGYYVHVFGFSASGTLWTGALLIAGGQLGLGMALAWSVILGCLAGAFVIAFQVPGARGQDAEVVTVRGPVTYAGPGSLGGTQSALRR